MANENPCDWGGCAVQLFRVHVGDFDDPPTWSDARAQEILSAAAYQVTAEVNCVDTPTFSYCSGGIFGSDPFEYPQFVNLWVLKAACLVDQGNLRTAAITQGVKAICGPATLEVKSGTNSVYKILIENGPCAAYQELLDNLCFKNPIQSAEFCSQVVGTFASQYYKDNCDAVCIQSR